MNSRPTLTLRRSAARLVSLMPLWPDLGSRQRHFVRDYRRLVRRLKAEYPLDEAMSLAVGGDYVEMGAKLADIMVAAGLLPGGRLLDLGCGSGRLASTLSQRFDLDYAGIDIIPDLLAYARSKTPENYRFILNRNLDIPLPDGSFDYVAAFSLFTHLKHEETFAYLAEARRVLSGSGTIVFSFIEFAEPGHWPIFEETRLGLRTKEHGQANVFIERPVITLWARRLGFAAPTFVGPGDPGPAGTLGQSVAILKRA